MSRPLRIIYSGTFYILYHREMKVETELILLFIMLLMVIACVTASIQIPKKYALDSQLERVENFSEILRFKGKSRTFPTRDGEGRISTKSGLSALNNEWIKVDHQSLIIPAGNQDYYLLVLKAPSGVLMSSDLISLSISNVTVINELDIRENRHRHLIDRIYKIDSEEKASAIRDQILGIPIKYKVISDKIV